MFVESAGYFNDEYIFNKASRIYVGLIYGILEITTSGSWATNPDKRIYYENKIYQKFYENSDFIGKHTPLLPGIAIENKLHLAYTASFLKHTKIDQKSKETAPNLFQVVHDLALHSDEVHEKAGVVPWGLSLDYWEKYHLITILEFYHPDFEFYFRDFLNPHDYYDIRFERSCENEFYFELTRNFLIAKLKKNKMLNDYEKNHYIFIKNWREIEQIVDFWKNYDEIESDNDAIKDFRKYILEKFSIKKKSGMKILL